MKARNSRLYLGLQALGKTFTMANIIEKTQKPTLVLAHNKTLAGQLYSEFKEFFPENNVEYFVSQYKFSSNLVLKNPSNAEKSERNGQYKIKYY